MSDESMYFAGFLMADGNISGNLVQLEINEKDVEILKMLKNFLMYTGEIKYRRRKTGRMCSLRIKSDNLKNSLKKYGVIEQKTKRCTVPLSILKRHNAVLFLRGMFDGDGCFAVRKKTGKIISNFCGNPSIVQQFREYVKEQSQIWGSMAKRGKHCDVVQYGQKDSIKLWTLLYTDDGPRLDRKYKAVNSQKEGNKAIA